MGLNPNCLSVEIKLGLDPSFWDSQFLTYWFAEFWSLIGGGLVSSTLKKLLQSKAEIDSVSGFLFRSRFNWIMEEGLQQQQKGSSVYNQATSYGYGSSLDYDQSEDIESAARNALLREQVDYFCFFR